MMLSLEEQGVIRRSFMLLMRQLVRQGDMAAVARLVGLYATREVEESGKADSGS